jgi:uncharacterized protein with NRDE domain
MCSIILSWMPGDRWPLLVAANRDEMLDRPWDAPGRFWPDAGVMAGRDRLAGGTWLGLNDDGVVAALLNRAGSLGPIAGRRSRGELPLFALGERSATAACARILALDAADYRSFNMVIADAAGGFLLRGLEAGAPDATALTAGITMLTAYEPNDPRCPRIARYRPQFERVARPKPGPVAKADDWAAWGRLLADAAPPLDSAIHIAPRGGFGTVCSSLIALAPGERQFLFGAGTPLIYHDVYGNA